MTYKLSTYKDGILISEELVEVEDQKNPEEYVDNLYNKGEEGTTYIVEDLYVNNNEVLLYARYEHIKSDTSKGMDNSESGIGDDPLPKTEITSYEIDNFSF